MADPPPARRPIDFAQLEYSNPLSLDERRKLMPDDLKNLDQEIVDQIYARLTAGSIPDGDYVGQVFIKKGTRGDFEVDPLLLGYFGKMLAATMGVTFNQVAEGLWEGKVFMAQDRDKESGKPRRLLNRIRSLKILKGMGLVEGDPPSTESAEGKAWMLFPAKVYCGQSLLDSRRESIVIDYLFADELPEYRERPDFLAGRRGMQVRDEIRMVRPGFYIGRAYVNRVFLLTFTLYNKKADDDGREEFTRGGPKEEDCWTGTQAQRTTGSR